MRGRCEVLRGGGKAAVGAGRPCDVNVGRLRPRSPTPLRSVICQGAEGGGAGHLQGSWGAGLRAHRVLVTVFPRPPRTLKGQHPNKGHSEAPQGEYRSWGVRLGEISCARLPRPDVSFYFLSGLQYQPCLILKTRTKDKYRVVYTDHQRLELEKEFHYSRYITIRRKAELAATLGLSERQVKIWFQNRRAKERKINKKKLQQQQQQQQPQPPPPQPPQPQPGPLRSVPEPLSPVSSLQGSVPGPVPGVLGPAGGVLNPTVTQ
ncbi:caudal type homeobox 2 [Ictidomys tridecemlineatus]|nr:caudal type homeobox 2 [Ictidomys tridecemlineatus]